MRTAWRAGRYGAFWAVGLTVALVAEAQDQPSRPSSEALTLHARVRDVSPSTKGSRVAPSGTTEKILQWSPRRRPSSSATCGTSTGARGRRGGSASWRRR